MTNAACQNGAVPGEETPWV